MCMCVRWQVGMDQWCQRIHWIWDKTSGDLTLTQQVYAALADKHMLMTLTKA